MELAAGLKVTNKLTLVRPLEKGGMGSVWIAHHEGLDTEVAVKFVDLDIKKTNTKLIARFKREAAIAAKLKNPHAVQTYDHGVLDDGTPYIVMELLEGESLHKRLRGGALLNVREASIVVAQMAQVLTRAHALGVVHRDIKPPNIFLIDTGYELFIKLLDFGIAKHGGAMKEVALTKTHAMLGSPLYMSPEQFMSVKEVDSRADLWSLAVVLYHCLVGHTPFRGETLGQVMMAVMNFQFTPISEVDAGLPKALDGWFAKAFARDLNYRFQTAKEMADAFMPIAAADPEARATPAKASAKQGRSPSMQGTQPTSAPSLADPTTPSSPGTGARNAAAPDTLVTQPTGTPLPVAAASAVQPVEPASARATTKIPVQSLAAEPAAKETASTTIPVPAPRDAEHSLPEGAIPAAAALPAIGSRDAPSHATQPLIEAAPTATPAPPLGVSGDESPTGTFAPAFNTLSDGSAATPKRRWLPGALIAAAALFGVVAAAFYFGDRGPEESPAPATTAAGSASAASASVSATAAPPTPSATASTAATSSASNDPKSASSAASAAAGSATAGAATPSASSVPVPPQPRRWPPPPTIAHDVGF